MRGVPKPPPAWAIRYVPRSWWRSSQTLDAAGILVAHNAPGLVDIRKYPEALKFLDDDSTPC